MLPKVKDIPRYLLLCLLPSYVIFSLLWSVLIYDKLFHQTDYIIFFLDFLPFGVHNGFVDKQYGETYVNGITPTILYAIWGLFVLGIFFLSFVIFKFLKKDKLTIDKIKKQ